MEDLAQSFENINNELTHQYIILYRPEPLKTDGLFHPIELRVKGRKELSVRVRHGLLRQPHVNELENIGLRRTLTSRVSRDTADLSAETPLRARGTVSSRQEQAEDHRFVGFFHLAGEDQAQHRVVKVGGKWPTNW